MAQAAKAGSALFLEDKPAHPSGSEFLDVYKRMSITYRCTAQDHNRLTYSVFDTTNGMPAFVPVFMLEFGADNSLGAIHFGPKESLQMKKYLTKTSILASTRMRKFTARDGAEYSWQYRGSDDYEWTLLNSNGDLVAYYRRGGPTRNPASSMLIIEDKFKHVACEIVATLKIMKHIATHNL
ncbi:hypothetical protein AMATHDRAFT_137094 [Amanita thiersii Skay4041]|uniref:DUF6593 domain-containing protein n=1 Tax=Amanita thiersii Skay4041 TaxID=703135 RepID=A0A2A9P028_9AGAR|nr:hypothetical protein AMATHDRAFT_137094 [Amanita thiersii Skay4041]